MTSSSSSISTFFLSSYFAMKALVSSPQYWQCKKRDWIRRSRSPPVCWDARLPRLSPPCLTSFLLFASTAWGVGAAERNQGAVDGRQQTDVSTRGIIYLVQHTLASPPRQKQSRSPRDVSPDGQFLAELVATKDVKTALKNVDVVHK